MPAPADGIGARRVTSLLPIMGSWGRVTPFRRRPGAAAAIPSPGGGTASMTDARSYGSPVAFRRALTDKLKELAAASRWTLQQLQRQMAYDRLLERLYLADGGWIVKGAVALLARGIGVRATAGIDLYRASARAVAETDLRLAAAVGMGDWFRDRKSVV